MTNREKFMAVVNRNGKKVYEVAAFMGMSPQSLYNKIGNTHKFTAFEIKRFRELFPDVTDEEEKEIFYNEEG